jgi:hypothetical protein
MYHLEPRSGPRDRLSGHKDPKAPALQAARRPRRREKDILRAMKEDWRRARLGEHLAHAQIAVVGKEDGALLVTNRKRILRCRVREMIQSRIHARRSEEKTDDQESKDFEESFHVRNGVAAGSGSDPSALQICNHYDRKPVKGLVAFA